MKPSWEFCHDRIRLGNLALILVLAISTEASRPAVLADSAIPPALAIVARDFESGTLDAWKQVSESDLSLAPGGGRQGSTGLSGTVGQRESYLYQTDVAQAEEGYLAFWFNPNGVSIPDQDTSWIPGKSIRVARVRGSEQWHALVALRVPYILLQVTVVWLRAAHLDKWYRKLYPGRYCLVKFEDLLGDPEHYLAVLTSFLNVDLPSQRLESVVSNSSFADNHGRSGIHPDAINRWQGHINPWINRWFLFWCRKQLGEYGYMSSTPDDIS